MKGPPRETTKLGDLHYLRTLEASHIHTRREWHGYRRQYAIALPFQIRCVERNAPPIFSQTVPGYAKAQVSVDREEGVADIGAVGGVRIWLEGLEREISRP